ncbi:MAG TPA: PTS sugar transporter subunit IIA [Thermodesulfobacteriota bacterium]
MKITDFLAPDSVVADLDATTKRDVLGRLVDTLAAAEPDIQPARLVEALLERERIGSTGVGDGVAIPHAKLKGLRRLAAAFGRSRAGVDFEAVDGRPCHLFFLLVAPEEAASDHLRALSRIARLMRDAEVRRRLVEAPDAAAIYALLAEEDDKL